MHFSLTRRVLVPTHVMKSKLAIGSDAVGVPSDRGPETPEIPLTIDSIIASCRSRADRAASGARSQSAELPSTSVNRNVIVPVGRSPMCKRRRYYDGMD